VVCASPGHGDTISNESTISPSLHDTSGSPMRGHYAVTTGRFYPVGKVFSDRHDRTASETDAQLPFM
jgi:hypothetical protein